MEEIWKDIKNYEGEYQVSNLGRVRSIKFYEKVLKLSTSKDGYNNVCLSKGSKKSYRVNRLVAQEFLHFDMSNINIHIDHKDGDRNNNNIQNLQLLNIRENTSKRNIKTTSKYIGVSFYRNRWYSRISVNKRRLNLGCYDTEEQAYQAYVDASIKYNIQNRYISKIKETL